MIVRYETWGAWVKLESMPAIVALDRDGVRALGLDPPAGPIAPRPIEVHVAVTSRCAAGCEGCYLDARSDGVEPPRAEIEATFDALARDGVFTVAFGGGEPTLREDIGELADAARARGMTPVLTTSGLGLGDRKLERLARFAQVNVSYDGAGADYAEVRGFDGAKGAESAIARLAARGITVGVNVVLTKKTFPRVADTLRRARSLGATEVQLLRYKPQGRAKSIDYLAKRLSPAQANALPSFLRSLCEEHAGALRIRIDCALVPFLSADPSIRAEDLRRWGVLGCEAGALLGARRIDGAALPCSFAAPSDGDAFLAFAAAPPEPCASCTLRSVCRGGCKIVSSYVDGRVGPDPECPRVRAS